jgi:hypothetical protein
MNSYDSTNLVKALDDIAGSMPDASEVKDALGDVYNVLEEIGGTLTRISETLDREQTRFIMVTRLVEANISDPSRDEWRRELVNVSQIVRVSPDETSGSGAVVWDARGSILRVRETVEEITTMINAGAYVPPF